MIPWIILGILCGILLLVALLLLLKFKITIAYHEEFSLTVGIGLLRLRILPPKKKKKGGARSMSAAKARRIQKRLARRKAGWEKLKARFMKKKPSKKTDESAQTELKPKQMTVSEILDLLDMVRKVVLAVVKRFLKHLRVDVARMRIRIATGDAALTAVAYGTVTQSVNVLLPILRTVKNFGLPKTTNLDIQPDFLADSSQVDICISFSIRTWQMIHIGLDALLSLIKHYFEKLDRSASTSPSASLINPQNSKSKIQR